LAHVDDSMRGHIFLLLLAFSLRIGTILLLLLQWVDVCSNQLFRPIVRQRRSPLPSFLPVVVDLDVPGSDNVVLGLL